MLRQISSIYEFGPFRLDSAEKTLWRDGQPVPLTPKAFDTLLILVEKSGRLVEKGDLMRQLWPDSFVEENSLSQNIYLLRKALEKDAQGPNYIETVPRRGYRFIAEVRVVRDEEGELAVEQDCLPGSGALLTERELPALPPIARSAKGRAIYFIASLSLLAAALFAGWVSRGADEPQQLAKRYTNNPAAYQDYARGLFFWSKRTEDGLTRSITYFKQALEKDSRYALAWAGLADAYAVRAYLGSKVMPEQEAYQQAQAAALRALELDNTLAEAHAALSVVKAYRDYDLRGAEAAARQAIALQNNYATAHQRHSIYLRDQGRLDEALAAIQRAQELDPLSLTIGSNLAYILYLRQDFERAVAQCRKVLETEPDYFQTMIVLGMTYEQQQKHDEAITVLSKAREQNRGLNGIYLNTLETLGHAYAAAGRRAEAEQILVELSAFPAQPGDTEYYSALIRAGLGETDKVFALLERSSEGWHTPPVVLTLDPRFERLRTDARYQNLFKRRVARFMPA
ncbi:MAG: winged helix-turn-helix domain-containing protein [Acidobacteria bacterium]|nr:winged helix-turn-helix domain-containing protein [Acidobacteriota bacterium]